jgi:hypothetical protein
MSKENTILGSCYDCEIRWHFPFWYWILENYNINRNMCATIFLFILKNGFRIKNYKIQNKLNLIWEKNKTQK